MLGFLLGQAKTGRLCRPYYTHSPSIQAFRKTFTHRVFGPTSAPRTETLQFLILFEKASKSTSEARLFEYVCALIFLVPFRFVVFIRWLNQSCFISLVRPVRPNSRDDLVDPLSYIAWLKRVWGFIEWPRDILETLLGPIPSRCPNTVTTS